jgi:Concanavalin A-like lectin/glucanases superfamily
LRKYYSDHDLWCNRPGLSGVRIIGAGPQEVAPDLDGSAVLADGPVAFWRLGDAGGATAADATGNGYNGTYIDDVTPLSAAPTNDGAALLTGAGSYVSVPYSPALNPLQFTIEAWVYVQPGAGYAYERILNMDDTLLTYRTGNITLGVDGSYYQPSAPLPAGVWTDIVATFDSGTSTASLYINGELIDSASPEAPVEADNAPLQFGPASDIGGATWNVGLCEVALYNDVLTAGQIQAQYAQAVYTGTDLNRGNTSTGSYGIELDGAVNVTLSNLSISDGAYGIYSDAGASSTGLTVSNVDLYGNGTGIDLGASTGRLRHDT